MNTPAPMPNYASYVTNPAVKSGNASDPSVWTAPPADGDWLGIPVGITINWDLSTCPRLNGIYVAGTLDAGKSSGALVINAGTIFADMGGSILAGDCMNDAPLAADSLTVTFLDIPIDTTKDPGHFSGGLLTMGATPNLCGSANKDGWLWSAGCKKGDTTITLLSAPNDWNPGDRVLIPGCFYSPIQDEVIAVASVSGNVVTLASPLAYDHLPLPGPQGQVNNLPVGNLTRRITFQSENASGTRGHIMFMRDASGMASMVNACHVAVKDCGRTRADIVVTDPQVDSNGVLVPGTDSNPRARYSWHSHRQGQAASALQTWDTLVVEGFLKIGFNNHDSNVNRSNLVAYNGQGSCFFTERGTEIGTDTNLFGCRTSGVTSYNPTERANAQDFGFNGNGYWAQGPGVALSDSVFCGHVDGFHPNCQGGPLTGGAGVVAYYFPRANVPASAALTQPTGDPPINACPMFSVGNITSFGCTNGQFLDALTSHATPDVFVGAPRSVSASPNTWNCGVGVWLNNCSHNEVDNATCSGAFRAGDNLGIYLGAANDTKIVNPQLAGLARGVNTNADMEVDGGYFANTWDFFLFDGMFSGIFTINGSPVFGPVPGNRLNVESSPYSPIWGGVNGWFFNFAFLLPDGTQLYMPEQQPGFVPFPSASASVPPFLVGLTNQQIYAQYGMAVCGAVAPAPVQSPWSTNGTIGPPSQQKPTQMLLSGWQSKAGPYKVLCRNWETNAMYQDSAASTLASGWNVLQRTIGGQPYTFFVQGI